jgi:hypothetical protein
VRLGPRQVAITEAGQALRDVIIRRQFCLLRVVHHPRRGSGPFRRRLVALQLESLATPDRVAFPNQQAATLHAEFGVRPCHAPRQPGEQRPDSFLPPTLVDLDLERASIHAHRLGTTGQHASGDLAPGDRESEFA